MLKGYVCPVCIEALLVPLLIFADRRLQCVKLGYSRALN